MRPLYKGEVMRQIIDGYDVYVVEFDTLPERPIIWTFEDEKPYALALGHALRTGVITEPGKYGIHKPMSYSIFTIKE
jgi:hypothetical protein